jgi:hypothetical protein
MGKFTKKHRKGNGRKKFQSLIFPLYEKHRQKEVIVRTISMCKELLQFPYENARLETIHSQGEPQQIKI